MKQLHEFDPVVIRRLIENEGWERDYEVTEPSEPTFTEP